MDEKILEIQNLFSNKSCTSLPMLSENLEKLYGKERSTFCNNANLIDFDIIDEMYLSELKKVSSTTNVYFGPTLRDIKCVITDNDGLREHEIYIKYDNSRKYVVHSVNLPFSPCQVKEYNSLDELLGTYKNYINSLSNYFHEMERIDHLCPVVEPLHPTYKDDFRKIHLDNRTWLHIEVTHDGTASNIHLIGHSEIWNDKLHSGLLSWDHDKDIVDNLMAIFDISSFTPEFSLNKTKAEYNLNMEKQNCGICLCHELPNNVGIPQPLCQNSVCGVYFHRSCLYEWLLACTGGRPPSFGVITGSCPACLHPITCCEN